MSPRHRQKRAWRASGRHRRPTSPVVWVLRGALAGAIAVATTAPLPGPRPDDAVRANGERPTASVAAAPAVTPALLPSPPASPTTTPPPPVTTTTTVPPSTTTRKPAPTPTTKPLPLPVPKVCASVGWGVKPHVAQAGHEILAHFGLLASIVGGWRASSAVADSDHPKGLALDFMVGRLLGDQIAAYALANRAELGVTYVIWRQRINYGPVWQAMPDRGGITANHFDHVHVSFAATPSGSPTC